LEPYRLAQLNGVLGHLEIPDATLAWAEFEVVSGDGAFVGFGSVIDGVTGDSIYLPAQPHTAPDAAPGVTR
jgi:hypothetical protein